MLELKNIKKTYVTGDEKVEALKGITLRFRKSEFVSILGQSGCGKTTLLNIVGGLDRYTSGDLIIDGKSTKKFKDRDWDAYRNYKIGFVFQSYNLISHQTILSNVELALTIGGISKKERKERAIKALEEVGLKEHLHKKPNQLSGGQMQRVAIARALVNNPDIILADEPTGALDTKTSVQVMEILKKISKNKLIIMVTHNPDLAKQYSTRIINILDGVITKDSNPLEESKEEKVSKKKIGRTSMKFWTAFRLSLNNLLTKKRRTILVSFAGSIGIIGIALVQAVSNGFQSYVDGIQKDTLTSYPLTIMQETTDLTSMLLAMRSEEKENTGTNEVKEEQYISKMLGALSTNDLKSFNDYMKENKDEIEKDVATTEYTYSVQPQIYTVDATNKIAKLNPSEAFDMPYGSSSMMSSFTSIYSQMIDNPEAIKNSYDILAGHLPEKYDEMMIVLSEPNTISDLLVYSLGLRDTEELETIVNKILNGESVEINNEAMTLTYEDLMSVKLKMIMPTDLYKYNEKYNIYENMEENAEHMQNLYNNGIDLKIVGVVSPKEGSSSMMLTPGVSYREDLVDYIINYSKDSEIVKKQMGNPEVNVFSGKRFDEKVEGTGLDFQDFINIDTKQLESAFNVKIDQNQLKNETQGYMAQINGAISTNTDPAKQEFSNGLNTLANGILGSAQGEISDVEGFVTNYLNGAEATNICASLEKNYVIPSATFKTAYAGLLKSLVNIYVSTYNEMMQKVPSIDPSQIPSAMPSAMPSMPNIAEQQEAMKGEMANTIVKSFLGNAAIEQTENTMARAMTEAVMKKTILTKVGELTANLTSKFASAFNVDQNKIASAFKVNVTEEEITRIVTSLMTDSKETYKSNLSDLGYQNKEEPTAISFYFDSFDGKEDFIKFLNSYNDRMENEGNKDKVINYTDTTGVLMSSVKTIVNAVTYVLIAFTSISLVVSSIMIGIITYISVYERTKEIGILRAIGASKRNISSIFNAETFIIGLLSGLIGIGISYGMIPIINTVLHKFIGNIPLYVTLYFNNAAILVVLSVVLTLIGGLIPARSASKKDPVIALRTE